MGPGAEDCVSAWFVMFLNLGLTFGPIIGTIIVDSVGFENAMAICGLGIAAYGSFAFFFSICESRKLKRRKSVTLLKRTPTPLITIQSPGSLQKGLQFVDEDGN